MLDTGGATAESTAAGVSINYIPKEGSNSFSGIFSGMYSGSGMNSNNLGSALMDGSWYNGSPTARSRAVDPQRREVRLRQLRSRSAGR